MKSRLVLVEYVKDVTAYSGHKTLPDGSEGEQRVIAKGTRRKVDAASAKALIKSGDVKAVDAAEPAGSAVKVEPPAGGAA